MNCMDFGVVGSTSRVVTILKTLFAASQGAGTLRPRLPRIKRATIRRLCTQTWIRRTKPWEERRWLEGNMSRVLRKSSVFVCSCCVFFKPAAHNEYVVKDGIIALNLAFNSHS